MSHNKNSKYIEIRFKKNIVTHDNILLYSIS